MNYPKRTKHLTHTEEDAVVVVSFKNRAAFSRIFARDAAGFSSRLTLSE